MSVLEGQQNCSSHLKCFTEHVFPFFTPKQVDDHLFTVQPPQSSEVSVKHIPFNIISIACA